MWYLRTFCLYFVAFEARVRLFCFDHYMYIYICIHPENKGKVLEKMDTPRDKIGALKSRMHSYIIALALALALALL